MPVLQSLAKLFKPLFIADDILNKFESEFLDPNSPEDVPRARWIGTPADVCALLPHCSYEIGAVTVDSAHLGEVEHTLANNGFVYNARHTQWTLRAYGLTLCTVEFTPGDDGQVFVQINEDSAPFVDQENAVYGAH